MKTFFRNLLFFSAFVSPSFLAFNGLFAQTCTLTGSTNGANTSQQNVIDCLIACNCSSITITGGKIDMTDDWDLRSRGNIAITITATGELRFPNGVELYLTAGSSITINSGGQLTTTGGSGSDPKIIKGTVTYTISQLSGLVAAGGILPVELANFEAALNQQTIALSWQTSAELNNDKFIIETSSEGEVFNRIGEIAGAGTSTETHNYQFTHHTPSAGVNYYRLKQVDFDGTFAYSKVLAIDAPGSQNFFAFPNPAKDKITLQYDYSKGRGNIQLFDALGRRVNTTIAGYAGNYEVKLPEGLPKGTYWLKVERGGKVQTVPVVKE